MNNDILISQRWNKAFAVFLLGITVTVTFSGAQAAPSLYPESPKEISADVSTQLSADSAPSMSNDPGTEEQEEGLESPRERRRVLQKRNPIASEYQEMGNIGLVFGASEDSEGSDFRGFFPTAALPLNGNAQQRFETFATYQNYRRRILPGAAMRLFTPLPTSRPAAIEIDARLTHSDRYIDQYRSAWGTILNEPNGLEQWILERPRFSRDRLRTRTRTTRINGEYAVSPVHSLFAHLIAGDYKNLESRNRYELNFRRASFDQATTGVPGLDLTYSAAQTNRGTVRRNFRETNNYRTTLRSMVGGRHLAPSWILDYSFFISQWINRPVSNEWNFTDRDMQLSYRNQNPEFPTITIDPANRMVDSSETEFSNYRIRETRTADDDLAGRIDANINLFRSDKWTLMTGLLYREKTRFNQSQRHVFEANPENSLMLASVMKPLSGSRIIKGFYQLPPWLDIPAAAELINDPSQPYLINDALSLIETNEQSYKAFESVAAWYATMAYRSSLFDLELGLRPEWTNTRTTGTVIVPENFADPNAVFIEEVRLNDAALIIQQRSARNHYSDLIGSVSLAFRPSPLWQIRAGASDSLMRPQYFDIVEYRRVNLPRRVISEGNPSLTPTYIRSFVFSIERFSLPIGDIGFELNRIEIADFFYSAERIEFIDGLDFTSSRVENGEQGRITGFQLQWQLDIPPLIAKMDATLSSAYTYSHSEATVATRTSERLPVPERSRHLFLTKLRVRYANLTGNLDFLYQSSALDSIGESRSYDIYRGNVRSLNSGLSYNFENYTFTISVSNLLNHPERSYIGEPNRIIRNLFTSQVVRMSVNGQW